MMRYFGYGFWFAALMVVGATSSSAAGCPQGTVWREATRDDHVCVSPTTRAQTWSDTKTNPHETCPRGLVWREATQQDHVCVDPRTRAQTWNDNANAPRDTVSPISGQRQGVTRSPASSAHMDNY
jgi:hypothetical protein